MNSDFKSNGDKGGSSSASVSHQQTKRSASYPGYSLRQAEELAKAAFDLGARNCNQDKVAQAAKYSANGGAFKVLRATAKQFGLIQVEKNGDLSVTEDWIQVFLNSENLQLAREERRKAMLQPKLYKQIIEEYTGRQFPGVERLAQELHLNQKYGILKDAAGNAARLFLESANYANLLNEKGYLVDSSQPEQEGVDRTVEVDQPHLASEEQGQNIEAAQHKVSKLSNRKQSNTQSEISVDGMPSSLEGLDRHEITLTNGKKAYLYVPVPLPRGEKERLKKYLSFISDLILEEPFPNSSQQATDVLKTDPWDDQR